MNLSIQMRNQMVSQYEVLLGTSPILQFRSGTPPSTCEDADSGTLLATITLPNDWMTNANNGTVSAQGTWSGTGITTGIIGYYRLKTSGGTTHEQGTVYQTGGTGDMELDNINITPSQIVQVIAWTRTQGGQ